MFRKFFNGETKSITAAAVIIGAASLVSRLLGVFRDHVLAGEFGAGETLDIYYAAFRIPDLVFNLVVLGAISAGFIPVFADYLKRDLWLKIIPEKQEHAWQLVSNLFNVLFLGLTVLALILGIFTPQIMPWLVPGFSAKQLALVVDMTRIMFFSPVLLGLSTVLGGVLQTYRRFFVYSLAPILYNVGIIFGALFLAPALGIFGLAWGVVLGAVLHFLIQLGAVFDLGWRWQWLLDFKEAGLRQILKIMVPRTLALAVSQVNLFVITTIASTLPAGSITVFNLASNLQSFPLGIFGISFAVAAFPALSESVKKPEDFIANFSATLRQILFFVLPASALLILLRAQIVRVILGSGQFDWAATIATMDTLAFFAISLFAQSLLPLALRAFYASHDSVTPFLVGLVSAGLNVVLSLALAPSLGVAGLALAFSLGAVINLAWLWVILHWRWAGLGEGKILVSVIKISAATLVMAIVVQRTKLVVAPWVGTQTFIGVLLQSLAAGGAGIIVYLLTAWLLRSAELQTLAAGLRRRLFRGYKPKEMAE